MISMEQWEDIRLRCVRDGEPKKRVARDLGIAPNTVRKYVRQTEAPQPPRYERRSKIDPFVKVIDAQLESTPKSATDSLSGAGQAQGGDGRSCATGSIRRTIRRRCATRVAE